MGVVMGFLPAMKSACFAFSIKVWSPPQPSQTPHRYNSVAPVTLTAGENYIVAALYRVNDGDAFSYDSTSFSAAPDVVFVGERYHNSGTLTYTEANAGGNLNGYFSANFKYGAAVVPEAGTASFLGLALPMIGAIAVVRRRNKK
jgi:hypothetical protein